MDNKREEIISKIKSLYPSFYQEVVKAISQFKPTTFRVNTLKADKSIIDELAGQGIRTKIGPFENSYIVVRGEKKQLVETKAFKEGLIYLQELSSMIPPLVLEPKEGEQILDLTAAPGSKSTQIASLTDDKAFITCVEKDKMRVQTLSHNLTNQGVKNFNVLNEDGVTLYKKHPEFLNFFDKILLDGPCSSEGTINLSIKKTYDFWNPKRYKDYVYLQKGLITSAYKMLKPGGTLVYSTCTFSVEENEGIVDWAINRLEEQSLRCNVEDMNFESRNLNYKNGFTKYNDDKFSKELQKTIRIIPNDLFNAFYIAKIKKLGV